MGLMRGLGVAVALTALAWGYGCSQSGQDATSSSSTSGPGPTGSGGSTSSSSTSGMTTASTASGMSTSSGPIMCSGEYTNIPKGDCDLLLHNCPEKMWCNVVTESGVTTSKCEADGGGLKEMGKECTTNTECKAGLSCIDEHCSPFCCPATNQPCDKGTCDVSVSFGGGLKARACSFLPICNLFKGDCTSPKECHLADGKNCVAVCDKPSQGQVKEGGMCEYRNDCGDSQLCNKNDPDKGVCRYFCDTTTWMTLEAGKGGCPAMRTCTSVNSGCTNLGICTPK